MHGYSSYSSCIHQLNQYFTSGLTKIFDYGNFNHIEYPKCMTDKEALAFDRDSLSKDFTKVGKDIRKAIDSYENTHTIRK